MKLYKLVSIFFTTLLFTGILSPFTGAANDDCPVPGGLSVSNNTGASMQISWNAAPGAIRYEVEIEDGENTPPFHQEFNTTQTAATIEGLTPGGQYKFKVKSKCSSGSSDHSPWFFFTAGAGDNTGGGSNPSGGSCSIPDGLNVSNNNGASIQISWNAAPGAIRYEVEIEDGENTPPFQQEFNTTQTASTIEGLTPGGQYKFKVKSECSSGSSDHSPWFFFTAGAGDNTGGGSNPSGGSCSIPDGLNVSNNTGVSIQISWNAAPGAIRYEVEIEDGENTPPFHQEFNTTQTASTIEGLTPGGQYKFKVKSECSSGSSDHSPWFFFTAGAGDNTGGGNNPSGGSCSIPDGLNVSNNTGASIQISWNAAPGAIRYEVEIEDGENTPPFHQEFNTSQTTATIEGLTPGGQYKFKVKSECSSGSSDHSPWFFFTAGAGDNTGGGNNPTEGSCSIPDGLNVSNNTGASIQVSWNAAPGAIRYEVEIEDGENTPPFHQEFNTTQTASTIEGLTPGGQYKFKVKSECSSGSSDHSPWFFFTAGAGDNTGGGNNPTGGSCSIPDGLGIHQVSGTSATLFWNKTTGTILYEIEIEDDENTLAFHQILTTADTTIEVSGLVPGGNYQFKVKSQCGSGDSEYSQWFIFTTEAQINQSIININAFPNPVANVLNVSLSDLKFEGKVFSEMIDLSGRIVWSQTFDFADLQRGFQIPVSNFREGFYQLSLRSENKVQKTRIFVHH